MLTVNVGQHRKPDCSSVPRYLISLVCSITALPAIFSGTPSPRHCSLSGKAVSPAHLSALQVSVERSGKGVN
jgi:hypothetical protein